MSVNKRSSISILLPAAAALSLLLLYFFGKGPEPVSKPAPPLKASPAEKADPFAGYAEDEARKESRKAELMPDLLDMGAERDEKEYYKRMKVLGTSPVETVRSGDHGLVIGENGKGFEKFLAEGGHYSGRLPAAMALQESKKEQ
ncbi:MAG: hypothetical protein V2A76_07670 [Planctomycetota bacterium]